MNMRFRKMLSILCAVCLVLTGVPFHAFSDENLNLATPTDLVDPAAENGNPEGTDPDENIPDVTEQAENTADRVTEIPGTSGETVWSVSGTTEAQQEFLIRVDVTQEIDLFFLLTAQAELEAVLSDEENGNRSDFAAAGDEEKDIAEESQVQYVLKNVRFEAGSSRLVRITSSAPVSFKLQTMTQSAWQERLDQLAAERNTEEEPEQKPEEPGEEPEKEPSEEPGKEPSKESSEEPGKEPNKEPGEEPGKESGENPTDGNNPEILENQNESGDNQENAGNNDQEGGEEGKENQDNPNPEAKDKKPEETDKTDGGSDQNLNTENPKEGEPEKDEKQQEEDDEEEEEPYDEETAALINSYLQNRENGKNEEGEKQEDGEKNPENADGQTEEEKKASEEAARRAGESVDLESGDFSAETLSDAETSELIQYIPQTRNLRKAGAKSRGAEGTSDNQSREGYAAFEISLTNSEKEGYGTYTVPVELASAIDLIGNRTENGKEKVYTLNNANFTLYHLKKNEDGSTEAVSVPVTGFTNEEGYLTGFEFKTDGFSVYLLKYTVDFHYEGVDYSIPGNSQILLSELIEQMQIKNGDALLDVADVESVSFSDERLVTVEQVSGLIVYNGVDSVDVGDKDYLLSSIAPFKTEENLIITLADSTVIPIGVTDDAVYYGTIHLKGRDKLTLQDVLGDDYKTNCIFWSYQPETIVPEDSYSAFSNLSSIPYDNEGYSYIYDYDVPGYTYYFFMTQDIVYKVTENGTVSLADVLSSVGLTSQASYAAQQAEGYNAAVDYSENNHTFTVSDISNIPEEGVLFNVIDTDENLPLSFGILIVAGSANFEYSDGIFTYEVDPDAGTAEITGFDQSFTGTDDLTIPAAITVGEGNEARDFSVTSIAKEAFSLSQLVKNVIFSGPVTINASAFYNSSIESVTVSDLSMVKSLDNSSLYGHPVALVVNGDTLTINHGTLNSTKNYSSITMNADTINFGNYALQTQGATLKRITINCTNPITLVFEVFGDEKAGDLTIDINAPVASVNNAAFRRLGKDSGGNYEINFNQGVGTIAGGAFDAAEFGAGTVINIQNNGTGTTVASGAIPDSDKLAVHFEMYESDVTGAEALNSLTATTVTYLPENPTDYREQGKKQILLSYLMANIATTKNIDVTQVASVTFPDADGITQQEVSGYILYNTKTPEKAVNVGTKDFLLSKDSAFYTTQNMTITMSNGKIYYINKTYTAQTQEFMLSDVLEDCGIPYGTDLTFVTVKGTGTGTLDDGYFEIGTDSGAQITGDKKIALLKDLKTDSYGRRSGILVVYSVPDTAAAIQIRIFEDPGLQIQELTDDGQIFTVRMKSSTPESVIITGLSDSYNDESGNIAIPATLTIGGTVYPVSEIDMEAFDEENRIKTITFNNGNSPILLGECAFKNCSSLKTVGGDGLVTYQYAPFWENPELISLSLCLSDQPQSILCCYNVKLETIAIHCSDVIDCLPQSFSFGNTALRTVSIPGGVKKISSNTFLQCPELENIILGNQGDNAGQVLLIERDAFKTNTKLKSAVTVQQTVVSSAGTVVLDADTNGVRLGTMLVKEYISADADIQAKADEYFTGYGYELQYIDWSLAAPDGTSVQAKASVDANVYVTENAGTTLFHKTETGVDAVPLKRFETGDESNYYTTRNGKVVTAVFTVDSFSPFAIGGHDMRYHDDMFWYDLTLDDNTGEVAGATVTGIYEEYSGTELVFSGVTRDTNAYPVTTVGDSAFKGNTTVTSVVFSNNSEMTVLGHAFQNMSALKTIQMNGTGLLTVGGADWEYPFGSCTSLTSVTGTGPVSFNAMGIFSGCSSLATVKLGDVQKINQNTFIDNAALVSFEADSVIEMGSQAFNRCTALDTVIVLGKTEKIRSYAFDGCNAVRVAAFNEIGTLYSNAFSSQAFSQDNHLVYIGKVASIPNNNPFGYDSKATVWFNMTFDDLYDATGGNISSRLGVGKYKYSSQYYSSDMYVSVDGYGDDGTLQRPYTSFDSAMGSMYYAVDGLDDFESACEAAGVSEYHFVFNGPIKGDFDGITLHVLPGRVGKSGAQVPSVTFPAKLYSSYVNSSSYISNPPATYNFLRKIVFEEGLTEIVIPDDAMAEFPNLESIEVKNSDAVVTIGVDAFAGTKVDNICNAKQIVSSRDGVVTIEKNTGAPIGTALVIRNSNGDRDAAIIQAARTEGLFDGIADEEITIKYFDLSLVSPNGTEVHQPAHVEVMQKLIDYTGADTIAPNQFGFFHLEESAVVLAAKEFAPDQSAGILTFSFDAEGFSPYAAAFTTATEEMAGFYTYLVDEDGHATITGYGPDFTGNVLNIPDESEEINGKTYKVVGIANDALKNPPEGITITSVVFNNSDPIIVGSGAFSGIATIESVDFAGEGRVEFKDTSAFAGSGIGSVEVAMPYGLTAMTSDGEYGAVFSGLNGLYTLKLGEKLYVPVSIPAGAFRNDTKIQTVTVVSGLADTAEFAPESGHNVSRGAFGNSAVGNSAFEGATALESFIVEDGDEFSIANEAFKDCTALTELSYTGNLRGLGENALLNTGFTNLTLKGRNMYLAQNALSDCSGLKSVVIDGDVSRLSENVFTGATHLEQLVFNGEVSHQLDGNYIRAEKLKVLVFKKGVGGLLDGAVYTEGEVLADSLTIYVGGECDDNPYIEEEGLPSAQGQIRIYMDLPITREKAHQSNDLDQLPNVVDLAYSLDEAPLDLYVDTDVASTASQNGTEGAPFSSFEKALEASTKEYDHASRFRTYFSAAGFDPDANGLTLAEGNYTMEGFTLHAVGGTSEITDVFRGNGMIAALVISTNGNVAVSSEAFKGCENLASVTIEKNDGGVQFGKSAFEDCGALEELQIDSRYTYYQTAPDVDIGEAAFRNCVKLTDITVNKASDLTVGPNAFENCAKLEKLYISNATGTTVQADGFRNSALKEIDIEKGNVTFEENAFRNIATLSSVLIDTTGTVSVKSGAFSECGEIDVVQLLGDKAPTVKEAAFAGTAIDVLQIQGGLANAEAGSFSGGTSYIDPTETFSTVLAEKIGSFKNIILPNAKRIDAGQQVFSGNDVLERVYLGANSDTNGGIAGDVFAGMRAAAVAYVAHKRGDFTDENRPTREGTLRFLDDDGYLFIDGTNTSENPDGSRENGFRTFAEAKQYAAEHGKTGTGTSNDYYYTDLAEVLRNAYEKTAIPYTESDIRFPVPSNESVSRVFNVVGTVTVRENETWDSDENDTITLLRYAGDGTDPAFTGELVRLTGGTLTLNNVVLDGNSTDAVEPLIIGNAGTTIEIHNGAQLRNNINTVVQWDNTISNYVSGGAIRTNGDVAMDGGLIYGNTAVNGGGVLLGAGSFDMSGGEISKNTLRPGSASISYIYGGGVLLVGQAKMTMSTGATVSGNRAVGGSGGGIALGTGYINSFCTLNMTGGTVSGNESTYEGGGLFIQIECEADIYGGSFTGNTSHGGVYYPNYGGGGIYVNGTHGFLKDNTGKHYPDGVLRLSKVFINGNAAHEEGGAIAGCGTSTSHIFITKGSAIYGNQAGDQADLYFDNTTLWWEGYGWLPASMEAVVSPYMWDGTPYNWIDAETNQPVAEEELSSIRNEEYHLRANPGEGAPASGSVIITGNRSDTKGGGVGSNGTVIIGYPPEGKTEWTPDVSKVLHNRDMEEGESFTFAVYRENVEFFQTGTDFFGSPVGNYTYGEDEFIGMGFVSGGKDGVPKKISFEPVEIKNLTAADVGKTYTYLILETTESRAGLITDTENYLAFNVTIGMAVKDGVECYTAKTTSVSMGKYSIDNEGKPVFETDDRMGDKNIRVRKWLSLEDAVFHNYSDQTAVSADKTWLNYDGSDTPPAGAKVTFRLLADGKQAKDLEGNPVADIELDGTADENGEYKAWSAKWSNLPALKTDDDGKPVMDDHDEYVKISYKVKEVRIELPVDSYAVYTSDVPNNGTAATNAEPAAIRNTQKTGDLEVNKTVVSDLAADKTEKTFRFTVTLSDTAIGGEEGKAYGDMTFVKGTATFILKDGEKATATGLPTGITYTVEETADDGFTTTVAGESGTISETKSTAFFTNTRKMGDLEVNKTVVSDLAADKTEKTFRFTVTLSDTAIGGEEGKAYGDMTFVKGTATFILKDGEKATATGLPVGITYTVEETADDGFTTTVAGESGTISETKSTAFFTNTRKTGDLEVNKTVVSDLAADKTEKTFRFMVTLSDTTIGGEEGKAYGDMTFVKGTATFSLKDGEKATATGLPTGITYTVEEAEDNDFTTTYTGETGTITETKAVAAFTNTRKTGGLEINKAVTSDEETDHEKAFSFTVTLGAAEISGTYGELTFTEGVASFTLKDGETVAAAGLPIGVGYTVEETAEDDFTTTYTGETGTITETKAVAAFTNTRKTGDLEVSKTVISDEETDHEKAFHFTVTLDAAVSGTYGDMTFTDGAAGFTLKDGESVTAIGLPVGASYTVEETADEDFITTYTGETGTISETKAVAAFTNTRKEIPKSGDLEVTKTVISDEEADHEKAFSFTVTLDDPAISGTYGDLTFTDGAASFTLKDGESVTATGLPVGIIYTVEETAEDDFTATYTGETGTITETKAVASFTNTRKETPKTGSLEVSKTVVSDDDADHAKAFSFTVMLSDPTISGTYGELTFTDGTAGFTLTDGETRTASGLPVDITYTVTETAEDDFTTTSSGETGTITEETATASFINTRREVPPVFGSLTVRKTVVSDETADHQKAFRFTVTLSDTTINGTYGGMTFADGTASFTLADGETAAATGLPEGITYTATEGADDDFTTASTGETGTITADGATASFTNTRKEEEEPPTFGSLAVRKTVVSDEPADHEKAFRFTVTLDDTAISGTYGGMTFADGAASFTLADGETITATGLPEGIAYTVTEEADVDFTTTSAGETGTITAAGAEASFTNTRREEEPPELGDLEITKTVVSNQAADRAKAFEFTVTLSDLSITGTYGDLNFENGIAVFTLTDGETRRAAGLPQGIAYTVEETAEDGYTTLSSGSAGTIGATAATAAFTNVRRTGILRITKRVTVDGAATNGTEADGAYIFTVTRDGQPIEGSPVTIQITNGAANTAVLEGLEPGVYVVHEQEAANGAELTTGNDRTIAITADNIGVPHTLTFVNNLTRENPQEPETVDIKGEKVWLDHDDQDGKRPEKIIISLYANGRLKARATVTAAKEWKWNFKDMPKLDDDGNEIRYTIAEEPVEGYTTVVNGNQVINLYTPATDGVGIIKIWDDMDNLDGSRPDSVEVTLLANGNPVRTLTLNEANNWSATVENLPKNENGRAIAYTWSEKEIPGYTPAMTLTGNVTVLTNTHQPDLTATTVRKVWDDNNNALGMRPESLTVILSGGTDGTRGTTIARVTLNEANHWTATVKDLPVSYKGETIRYTWTELEPPRYVLVNTEVVDGVTVFTNQLWQRLEVLDEAEDGKVKRPGKPLLEIEPYDTALGLELIINHVGHCFD